MNPLPAEAYVALTDALAKVYWRKKPFQRHIEMSFRDHPELLSGIPFHETKQIAAEMLVDRLVQKERKYRDFSLSLMLEMSKIQTFTDINRYAADRPQLLEEAMESVSRLGKIIEPLLKDKSASEARAEEQRRQESLATLRRQHQAKLEELKAQFLSLHEAQDKQQRGRDLETLLDGLFQLYDFSPRLAYVVESDQIDGAISYEGDDFIVEAKWTKAPVERSQADIFDKKISRVGKNGLGLFISINGFSSGFTSEYSRSTSFITIDGTDLFAILSETFRLDDVIRAKKRHANETGSCFYPVKEMLSQ